jgi:hypothetical protein
MVLARAGAIRAETECSTLGRAVDAYRRLRRGEVQGRAVVTPSSSFAPDMTSVTGLADRDNLTGTRA